MNPTVNLYCDESCHLEHDHQSVMVLGAVWCPQPKAREIAVRLREIKARHGLPPAFETKWGKVSQGKASFYQDVLDYFFDDDDLNFRALIANKGQLKHESFSQTHNEWYYKMYFQMLRTILSPDFSYRVFLDIKDTCGAEKIGKLHDVLCNNIYDFKREIILGVQAVRSHEVEQVQLADLLIGVISYANRGLESNQAKLALVNRFKKRSGYNLTKSTLTRATKVNLFHWEGR